jgi:hypothetical protein
VYYAIAPANLAFFGPLLAVWVLVGLWSTRTWPRDHVLLIVGWAASVYVFHAGAPWQNFRFTLAYLPPVAILAGAGLLFAWREGDRRARGLAAACAVLGLLLCLGASVRLVERFVDTKNQELTLVRWVQAQTPSDTLLFTFGPTLAFRHYSSLPTFDLFDLSPADMHDILDRPAPHYLLVNVASVDDQWLDQAPSINFHLLRDGPGLSEIGNNEGYTLYRVGAGDP